jgi:predicted phosphodiesterase
MSMSRIAVPRERVPLLSISAVVGVALISPGSAAADTLASWVQLIGSKGEASIRVIVNNTDPCPTLSGGPQMKVRAEPDTLFSDVRVCEAVVPAGTKDVQLDGKTLPLSPKEIRKVVVFGDTGCRLTDKKTQDCSTGWFYKTLAQHAADAKPDLVIHVGDYLYRELPCSAVPKPCTSGYGWDGWNADFFTPSQALFAAAPWIMVRGNHEICERAGDGWFRFLDHAPWNPTCVAMSDFFVVKAGGLGFAILDSAILAKEKNTATASAGGDSAADDDDEEDVSEAKPAGIVADLRKKFDRMGKVPSNAWLLTHVTFNAVRRKGDDTAVDNTVQQAALGSRLSKIQMLVSGHIHMFEAVSFANNKPPQLVVGTGGTKLAKQPDIPPTINGLNVAQSKSMVDKDFGYMLWERDKKTATKWAGTLFDQNATLLARCKLEGRDLRCAKNKYQE